MQIIMHNCPGIIIMIIIATYVDLLITAHVQYGGNSHHVKS